MEPQLVLLEEAESEAESSVAPDWRLDEATKSRGRQNVAVARRVLAEARRKEHQRRISAENTPDHSHAA